MAMRTDRDNSGTGLYFIVGGLVVLAIIFGFLFFAGTGTDTDVTYLEPAAGPQGTMGTQYQQDTLGGTGGTMYQDDTIQREPATPSPGTQR